MRPVPENLDTRELLTGFAVRLLARLALVLGLRRADPAPVRTWRDPAPPLCAGRPVYSGRALSSGGAP